jgi:hypothetical protein
MRSKQHLWHKLDCHAIDGDKQFSHLFIDSFNDGLNRGQGDLLKYKISVMLTSIFHMTILDQSIVLFEMTRPGIYWS